MKNITKKDKSLILEKHAKLDNVKVILKKEYVGLDDVIDEISNLVEPWYLFPNGQLRPTVINLWGLTSTGKTSLIQRLFELLELKSVLHFDIGEWVNKTNFELRNKISGQIMQIKKDNMIPVFVFDEFQLGRTIDDTGDEIDRPSLRVIWDLLDSGKFEIIEEKWETKSAIKLYTKLDFIVNIEKKEKRVKSKKGIITHNKEVWDLMFLEDLNLDDLGEKEKDSLDKYYSTEALVPINEIWSLLQLNNTFHSELQLCEYLMSLDAKETLSFIEEEIEKSVVPVEHDFSTSIIFNIGNLDSAYYNSDDMSPDIDADTLYEQTKKITLSDIKRSIKQLYRSEQISRLGNNHVIYKSLNKEMYKNIIKLELEKIQKKLIKKFELVVDFDSSINEIIYNESVFPTQGVRPIFSTLTSMIESYVGRIIVDSLKKNINLNKVEWKYKDDNYIIKLISEKSEEEIIYPVQLKIDNIRKSKSDDIQSLVGLHEAGHVVASLYSLEICPKKAASRTSDDNGGYTFVESPEWETKDLLLKSLDVLLGGYAAEKLVFGSENQTSGSYSDLSKATETSLSIFKSYGMNDIPATFSVPDFRISNKDICLNDDNLDYGALSLIEKSLKRTERILNENMELLLQLGKYLSENSKIEMEQIKEFVEKYGAYIPKYKTKDNFYDYKEILDNKLKEIGKLKIKNYEN